MGVDFIQKRAKPFVKGWDKARLEIATRNLFTREIGGDSASVVAKVVGPGSLAQGEEVLVCAEGNRLLVLADRVVRAETVKAPEAIVEGIGKTGGYAKGRIEVVYPTLGLVEVSVR